MWALLFNKSNITFDYWKIVLRSAWHIAKVGIY